ncbi:Molybdenum ABC transporter, periplasmic molybdenum-binding protein ModA (TC 3.A.1.8.1) [hydrothermal vent metagenome]|uniref:Molybdenum ABC transporter, periplasmic molybdenum-binding protein ModA (TC 3.A.1.8.1) n=1 Tax=hydrothermal vent metagenome TaxID=652676 RepID=A0A3B0XNC9_9ZZZZ
MLCFCLSLSSAIPSVPIAAAIADTSRTVPVKPVSVELRIASAANFYLTLKKLKSIYEATSTHEIVIIRGSTGKLYAQIVRGAPYDIFFSADSQRVEKLVQQGRGLNNQSWVYAKGQLALWRADADSSQQLREQLEAGNFHKLAIANPRTAPYGRASVQALKSMELYEPLKKKLVYGENISQVYQFVQSGAADLGLVARAYVNHDMYWEVESWQHKPVIQKMLILKQTKHPEQAAAFIKFIQSVAARKIIEQDGYQLD